MFPTIFRAPADITSDAFGGEAGELFVQATPDEVALPEGFNPAEADFVREGPDLMMTGPDGTQVLVADFFMMETPPTLIGESGARVDGDLAVRLAGPVAPGQVAGETPEPGEIIGRVTEMNGEVVVIRADGTRMSLQTGDAVFQGDILDTDADAGVGILLADGTALAMGEEARMVLDEMVYDPDIQDGNIALSVMRGLFTIVSGEISKTGPEAMMVHTPVATIGIRGTQIGLDLSNGKDLTVVMMEEADGFVGEVMIINDGGAMTINQAYFAVTVSSYMSPPVAAPVFTMDSIASTFDMPLTYLPTLDTNANDYGQQAGLETDLSTFETAAGDLELGEQGLSGFESGAQDGAREIEIEPTDGLAEIENVIAESSVALDGEREQTLVTNAGQPVGADELEAEANVIFGDEIAPIETTPNVGIPVEDDTAATTPEPSPVPDPEPTPVPEPSPAPEPVPVNVAPVAEPGTAITAEDNIFNGQLSASDLEGGVLTFSLADDGGPANGTVVVNPDGSFTYEPNTDFGGTDSFTYMVSDDAGAMALASVSLTITPVADVPQVAVASVTGYEDSVIALALAVSMPAGTQENIADITINGVPEGATLSAGSDNGDGSWILEPGQLEGLSLTPPKDFNGTLDLGVSATSTDGGVSSSTFALHVSPVADVPQLAVADVVGGEDSSIMLTIAAAMPGSTSETIESIILSNVPNAVELSAGVDNGDGTWTLVPSDLGGLTMTSSPDYNGVFDIGVSVTSSDGGIATDTFGVNITPVADQPLVAAADVTGSEDAAIVLTLAAHMPADTSETVETVVVSGVPNGAVLSQGTDNGDGTWTLSVDQLADLTLTPPTDFNGTFSLSVSATSTDGGMSSADLDVTVTPLADVPQLAVADVIGAEDGVIGLTLTANMPAGTTEALYTITVEGVPDGASLSAGMDNGDGTWTLTPDLMDGLTLNPPQDFNGTFDLSITAASTDGGSVTETMGVTITPVADTPVVAVSDATGAEDSSILLTIAANMPDATSETLDTILITGVPDGAVLSAGSDNGDGTWTLEESDLDGLSITPASDYNGTFNLGVGVVSSDGSVASSTLSVNVGAVSDIPVIALSDVVGSEDTGIALTIAASMPAGTNETLDSITIAGVPDGASLNAGTDNGDGTWSVSSADLVGLTLSPPSNYSGTIQLSVTAVSSDGGTSTSTLNAAVTPVADAPILQVSDVVVTLETPPGMEIEGSKHSDLLLGTMGDDEIDGGSGHDIIFGDTPRTAPVEDDDGDDDDDDDDGHGRGHGKGHDEHGQGHGYGHDDDDHDDGEDGDEGAEPVVVTLDVNAALSDVDGSEALSLEIAGVPDGATLSVGTDNGDGSWTLLAGDLDHLDDLTMTLAPETPQDDFALDVTASSSELETGESATTTGTIDVSFDAGVGGDDEIDAGKGNDLVYGGGGDDKIDGGEGHDILFGGEGNDEIEGGKGSDILVGGTGDDELDGGKSSDVLIGGAGDDVLEGGEGDDAFIFRAGDGDDIVLDLSHQDVLRFEGQEFNMDDFALQSDQENDTTTITFGDDAGVSVTLNDVEVSSDSGYTVTQDGDAVVVTFDKDSIE